jgi:hypothetical protein
VNAVPETVQVRMNWAAAESAHALHANQVLAQLGPALIDGKPDGIYLTFGSAPALALMADADPEGTRRRIEQLSADGVQITVLGQFHIARPVLGQIIKLLQDTAVKYDEAEASPLAAEGGE